MKNIYGLLIAGVLGAALVGCGSGGNRYRYDHWHDRRDDHHRYRPPLTAEPRALRPLPAEPLVQPPRPALPTARELLEPLSQARSLLRLRPLLK